MQLPFQAICAMQGSRFPSDVNANREWRPTPLGANPFYTKKKKKTASGASATAAETDPPPPLLGQPPPRALGQPVSASASASAPTATAAAATRQTPLAKPPPRARRLQASASAFFFYFSEVNLPGKTPQRQGQRQSTRRKRGELGNWGKKDRCSVYHPFTAGG